MTAPSFIAKIKMQYVIFLIQLKRRFYAITNTRSAP